MTQNDSSLEVACTLTEDDEEKRSEEVLGLLISTYKGYEEVENGLEIRFEGTDDSLLAVAQFASDELKCCSFPEYDIRLSPPYDETILAVTGPEGTRAMFREGLVTRLKEERNSIRSHGDSARSIHCRDASHVRQTSSTR